MKVTYKDIFSDVKGQISHTNHLEGWAYHVKKFISHSDYKLSGLKYTHDKISMLDKTYGNLIVKAETISKAIMNDFFMTFFIKSINKNLAKDLAWSIFELDLYSLEEKHNIEIFNSSSYYASYRTPFQFLRNGYNYHDRSVIELPKYIKARLRYFFSAPHEYNYTAKDVTDISKYHHYNQEKSVFNLISLVIDASQKGVLKKNKTGKLTKASIKSIKKNSALPEVFDYLVDKNTVDFSHASIIQIANDISRDIVSKGNLALLQDFILNINKHAKSIYDIIMSVYKGNKGSMQKKLDIKPLLTEIKKLSADNKWIDPYKLLYYMAYRSILLDPTHFNNGNLYLIFGSTVQHKYDISHSDYFDVVVSPFLNGFIYILASFGIVETLATPESSYLTIKLNNGKTIDRCLPYINLDYFRLTKLGRYLLGLEKNYSEPETDFKPTEVILSSTSLTISLSEVSEPIAQQLKPFCRQLGKKLFQASVPSVMHKIQYEHDLDDQQIILRKLSGNDLPDNWLSFYEELYKKFNPLEEIEEEFFLYRVPVDRPLLTEDLMTNSELKTLYTKVDGRQILVKSSDIKKFRDKMKTLGWFMEFDY